MRSILSVADFELMWAQQSAFKSSFELRFGGELVATVNFPKMRATFAIAEAAEGTWKFERVGFWKSTIMITSADAADALGSYTSTGWKGGGELRLPDGRKFVLWRSFWKGTSEFRTEAGETLFQIQNHGALRLKASVKINRSAVKVPELPWMVPFAFYLGVLARNDAALAAATG